MKIDGPKLLSPDRKSKFNQGTLVRKLRVEFQTKVEKLGVFDQAARKETITNEALSTINARQRILRVEGKILILSGKLNLSI